MSSRIYFDRDVPDLGGHVDVRSSVEEIRERLEIAHVNGKPAIVVETRRGLGAGLIPIDRIAYVEPLR